MPTVRRSLWSLCLVWIVCLGLSIGGYALAASGLADKGMERLAQAWDVVSQAIKVTLATTLAGEDTVNGVLKTEERYLTIPTGGTDAMVSADQLYKSGPGYVRSITCYSDATATAGTIALRDNTAAGAGNILWSFDVSAVAYNTPFTFDLQTPFSIGLYLDFTTTADVKCMVRFR